MSRGMTPAILAMLDQRTRDKLRCVMRLRYGNGPAAATKSPAKPAPPLS